MGRNTISEELKDLRITKNMIEKLLKLNLKVKTLDELFLVINNSISYLGWVTQHYNEE